MADLIVINPFEVPSGNVGSDNRCRRARSGVQRYGAVRLRVVGFDREVRLDLRSELGFCRKAADA